MSERRCAVCGATNAAAAEWCGQCLTRFDGSVPPARPSADPVPSPPPVIDPTPPPSPFGDPPLLSALAEEPADVPGVRSETGSDGETPPASPTSPLRLAQTPPVRRQGDALLWRCPACESENPIERTMCGVCGTPLATLFGVTKETGPKRTGSTAIWLSMVLPGAGHVWAGRVADAIARGVLFLWTSVIGVFLVTRSGRSAGIFRGIGGVFVLTATGVWIISLLESQRLSRGDVTPLVPGRILLWATAALTGVLFLGLAAAAQTR